MIAARPLKLLVPACCVLAVLTALWLSVTGLGTLRGRRAMLHILERNAVTTRAPVGQLLPGGGYRDRARSGAAEAFRLRLLKAAVDRRLLVERIEIMPSNPDATAELVAHVTLSGREADVVGYAGAIERDRPLARFSAWRINRAAAGDSAIRLDATVLALWQGR